MDDNKLEELDELEQPVISQPIIENPPEGSSETPKQDDSLLEELKDFEPTVIAPPKIEAPPVAPVTSPSNDENKDDNQESFEPVAKVDLSAPVQIETPKQKNYTLLIIIAVVVLLTIIGIVLAIILLKPNKEEETKESEIRYDIYTQKYLNELHCYDYNSTLSNNYYTIEKLQEGDKVICEYNVELEDLDRINTISFELYTSESLELEETKIKDDNFELTNNSKNYKLSFKIPSNTTNSLDFVFRVTKEIKENNILLRNFKLELEDDKHYALQDIEYSFEQKGLLRRYKKNGSESKILISSTEFSYYDIDDYSMVDEFKCRSSECKIINSNNGYYLIYDNGLFLYYIEDSLVFDKQEDNPLVQINKSYNKNKDYRLILHENQPYGIIVNNVYYDLADDNIILSIMPGPNNNIFNDKKNDILIVYEDNITRIYNTDGTPYRPPSNALKSINGTNYYTFSNNTVNCSSRYCNREDYYTFKQYEYDSIILFNSNGDRLFPNDDIKSFHVIDNGIVLASDTIKTLESNGRIIKELQIPEGSKILKVLDVNYALIKEKKDDKYYLSIISYENNLITTIMEFKEEDTYLDSYVAVDTARELIIRFIFNNKYYEYYNTDNTLEEITYEQYKK